MRVQQELPLRIGHTAHYIPDSARNSGHPLVAAGRQVALQDALGYLHTSVYDPADRREVGVDPLGNQTTIVYNALGQAIALVDALGRRTTTRYDAVGRPKREQDAQTYVAAFIFDALGQRIALQDAHTRRWTSVYEVRGGELATQDPLRAGIIF